MVGQAEYPGVGTFVSLFILQQYRLSVIFPFTIQNYAEYSLSGALYAVWSYFSVGKT